MIRVASYNMRKGIGLDRRRDPGRVLSVLRELDADIVALQEADRRFGTRASAIPPHMFDEHSDYVPVDLLSGRRSEEHTSELQSLMRISYAVFCLKKKNRTNDNHITSKYNNRSAI